LRFFDESLISNNHADVKCCRQSIDFNGLLSALTIITTVREVCSLIKRYDETPDARAQETNNNNSVDLGEMSQSQLFHARGRHMYTQVQVHNEC
jgi:hypothetical protein